LTELVQHLSGFIQLNANNSTLISRLFRWGSTSLEILASHPVEQSRAGKFRNPEMKEVISTWLTGLPAEIWITPLTPPC